MAQAQKPDFVFRRNGRVHLNRRGRQFGRILAAEVCASAVVMWDAPCPGVVWRVLTTHSIRQFPFHCPSRASPCAISFQLDSTVLIDLSWLTQWIQNVSLIHVGTNERSIRKRGGRKVLLVLPWFYALTFYPENWEWRKVFVIWSTGLIRTWSFPKYKAGI